jgi:aspartate/tyrosine/aromatic aminotransferase
VLACVRAAEAALIAEQTTKTYVGPTGNPGLSQHVERLVFGAHPVLKAGRVRTVQTPAGGSLRLGAELIARRPRMRSCVQARPPGRTTCRCWLAAG